MNSVVQFSLSDLQAGVMQLAFMVTVLCFAAGSLGSLAADAIRWLTSYLWVRFQGPRRVSARVLHVLNQRRAERDLPPLLADVTWLEISNGAGHYEAQYEAYRRAFDLREMRREVRELRSAEVSDA